MADDFSGKDAAGTTRNFRATDSGGLLIPHKVIAPSENHIGALGGHSFCVRNSPGVAATSHVATDCVGGKQSLTLARIATGSLLINKICLKVKTTAPGAPLIVHIFDADPSGSTLTDDSTMIVAAADITKLVDSVLVPMAAVGTNGLAAIGVAYPSQVIVLAAAQIVYFAVESTLTSSWTLNSLELIVSGTQD